MLCLINKTLSLFAEIKHEVNCVFQIPVTCRDDQQVAEMQNVFNNRAIMIDSSSDVLAIAACTFCALVTALTTIEAITMEIDAPYLLNVLRVT